MKDDGIFINRELSWLDFNKRVLVLSKDKNVPLAEQMKFLAIYGSNLDELYGARRQPVRIRCCSRIKRKKPKTRQI